MIGGDLCSFAECAGNLCGIGFGIFTPLCDTEFSRVNSDHAVLADTMFFKDAGNAARHLHCAAETFREPQRRP